MSRIFKRSMSRTDKKTLPPWAWKQVSEYTHEGARGLRNDDLHKQQSKCKCGFCFADSPAQTSCTLFEQNGATLVRKKNGELCRTWCLSKSPLRMLNNFIVGLFVALDKLLVNRDGIEWMRFTLQEPSFEHGDHRNHPYLVDAKYVYDDHSLELWLFKDTLEDDGWAMQSHYQIGDELNLRDFLSVFPRESFYLKQKLRQIASTRNPQMFSLVVQSNGLPQHDLQLDNGFTLRYERAAYIGRPLYLFNVYQ